MNKENKEIVEVNNEVEVIEETEQETKKESKIVTYFKKNGKYMVKALCIGLLSLGMYALGTRSAKGCSDEDDCDEDEDELEFVNTDDEE